METVTYKSGLCTDEELICKINKGETALFEVLIRRYNPLLYKIARSYGLNHHDAEDLMQDAHFAAYKDLKNFRNEASYKTWLTRIILHKCYHKLNYGSTKYEEPGNVLINDNARPMYGCDNKQDTEKVIINKELAAILEKSLEQLPISYRSVFILREIEGFPVTDTAVLLNISTTNVKVRLNRAKAMLQKQLEYFYSATDLYEFHLRYCDNIVKNVFNKIHESAE